MPPTKDRASGKIMFLLVKSMIISVVGNAQSLLLKQYGKVIDSGDIVIRFNGGIMKKPISQGYKVTHYVYSVYDDQKILSWFFDKNPTIWRTTDPKFDEIKECLRTELEAKPSNGIIILEKLKREYPDATVRIFGFDWKASKTWYDPKEEDPTPGELFQHHDYIKEREYCLNLIEEQQWELY